MISIRLFAMFRETAGAQVLDLPHAPGQTVGMVWRDLVARHPDLGRQPASAALNGDLVDFDTALSDGDELAFLPPVSGG
jgi:molybdopterin synthase sulfur carrier subunit